jgi:Uma2 family endonuclease
MTAVTLNPSQRSAIAIPPIAAAEPRDAPTRVPMSYERCLVEIPDGAHVEWANGEAIFYVSASQLHQAWVVFLVKLLGLFVDYQDLGAVFSAPFAAKLWEDGPSREPDITFIAKDNLDRLTEERMLGPVDLAIEIASPGTLSIDRVDKFYEYQQSGVREYWLIDPRRGPSLTNWANRHRRRTSSPSTRSRSSPPAQSPRESGRGWCWCCRHPGRPAPASPSSPRRPGRRVRCRGRPRTRC